MQDFKSGEVCSEDGYLRPSSHTYSQGGYLRPKTNLSSNTTENSNADYLTPSNGPTDEEYIEPDVNECSVRNADTTKPNCGLGNNILLDGDTYYNDCRAPSGDYTNDGYMEMQDSAMDNEYQTIDFDHLDSDQPSNGPGPVITLERTIDVGPLSEKKGEVRSCVSCR